MKTYMHKETGSIDTREGWEESYPTEELEERGITKEAAFDEDESVTLFGVSISSAAATLGRKGGSVKSEKKTAAARENGKKGGRPRKEKP